MRLPCGTHRGTKRSGSGAASGQRTAFRTAPKPSGPLPPGIYPNGSHNPEVAGSNPAPAISDPTGIWSLALRKHPLTRRQWAHRPALGPNPANSVLLGRTRSAPEEDGRASVRGSNPLGLSDGVTQKGTDLCVSLSKTEALARQLPLNYGAACPTDSVTWP